MRASAQLGVVLLCAAAAACASLLGVDDVEYGASDDAGDAGGPGDATLDTVVSPDQAASDASHDIRASAEAEAAAEAGDAAPCFVCGNRCVPYDNPAFGCDPDASCQPCPGGSHADPTCDPQRACAISCNAGFLNCNAVPNDGCEVNPKNDPSHCGGCDAACAPGEACADASCVPTCPFVLCDGGGCVEVQSDPNNCGACGNLCPGQDLNGNRTCTADICGYSCSAGYGDCDNDVANGCETVVNGNDVSHCGSCFTCPLSPANATSLCVAGTCSLTCAPNYVDCNQVGSDGCECDTTTGALVCQGGRCCAPTGISCGNDPATCCTSECDTSGRCK